MGEKLKLSFHFEWLLIELVWQWVTTWITLKGFYQKKNKPIEMELLEEKATSKYKSTKYHKKINPEHKRKEPFDEYHKQKTKSNWIINKPVRIKLKLESPTLGAILMFYLYLKHKEPIKKSFNIAQTFFCSFYAYQSNLNCIIKS